MKKLTFKRNLFVKHPEMDFDDDGAKFRIYYYKDILPISATNGKWGAFVCIRLDYLGMKWEDYKEDFKVLEEFNGCDLDRLDMNKLIANSEYIIDKYNL